MGCSRFSPYLTHKVFPDGPQVGPMLAIWDRPYGPHMGLGCKILWDPYGRAHMGPIFEPRWGPHETHMGLLPGNGSVPKNKCHMHIKTGKIEREVLSIRSSPIRLLVIFHCLLERRKLSVSRGKILPPPPLCPSRQSMLLGLDRKLSLYTTAVGL